MTRACNGTVSSVITGRRYAGAKVLEGEGAVGARLDVVQGDKEDDKALVVFGGFGLDINSSP